MIHYYYFFAYRASSSRWLVSKLGCYVSNYKYLFFHVSRGTGAHSGHLKRNWSGARFPIEEIEYLIYIYIFVSSAKHRVEFRHSTRNVSERRMEKSLHTRFPVPTLLCAGYRVQLA